jgi:hypothetical protein
MIHQWHSAPTGALALDAQFGGLAMNLVDIVMRRAGQLARVRRKSR